MSTLEDCVKSLEIYIDLYIDHVREDMPFLVLETRKTHIGIEDKIKEIHEQCNMSYDDIHNYFTSKILKLL